jgi:hypothetical protein
MATWIQFGKDKFRTVHNDEVWWLEATPGAGKPWLLYTEQQYDGRTVHGKTQEIGAREPEAARRAAEFWLGLSTYGLGS